MLKLSDIDSIGSKTYVLVNGHNYALDKVVREKYCDFYVKHICINYGRIYIELVS